MNLKILYLFLILLCTLNLFGQNSDYDAKFLYLKAEDAFNNGNFEDAIAYCEKAANSLGKGNFKISSLQLSAYKELLITDCYNKRLMDSTYIDSLINSFISSPEISSSSQEVFVSIKQFELDYRNHKTNPCLDQYPYLKENINKPGVLHTSSGLQYTILRTGKGPLPNVNSIVKVHYVGSLIDGTIFDSSIERKSPAEFVVNSVIKGWVEALLLMPVGSKWKITVPPYLGYGSKAVGKLIPANSILEFELELISIVKEN